VKLRVNLPVSIAFMGVLCAHALQAQDSKINTNLGMGMTVPLNPTAQIVGSSVDVVVGAGYNFNKHHSLVGQFMWAGIPVNKDAMRPIYLIANTQNISGSSNLFAATANYRFRLQGRTFGVYWIGGGGMYYRRASLSQSVVVGTGTVCGPSWEFWGYGCVEGNVNQDQTLVKAGSTAFGGNGGMGFTIRINDDGYKFYVESRYHYAPTKNISTQLITITLGFAW
jgi:Outer membrane protein beta-barrel domain